MPNNTTARDAITKALKELGPSTCDDIARHLGADPHNIRNSIKVAGTEHFHVADWERRLGGTGGRRLTRMWAAGPGTDKPKPKPLTREQLNARKTEKHRAVQRAKRVAQRGQPNHWVLQMGDALANVRAVPKTVEALHV